MNAAPERAVWVEHLMGTAVSVHGIGRRTPRVEAAVAAAVAELRDIEAVFSPYLAGSDISRMRRGEISLGEADARVSVVAAACRTALERTDGRFDAWREGWFDPTGYVKGWAVDVVVERHLHPLLDELHAIGVNAGGDVRLVTAPSADWSWRIGIADPRDRSRVLATVDVRDGAVATSGTAERGAHIVDPRTGRPVHGLVSATVVADDLATADVWATTAVVSGLDDLSWIHDGLRTGLLTDGERTRRWLGATEISVEPVRDRLSVAGV